MEQITMTQANSPHTTKTKKKQKQKEDKITEPLVQTRQCREHLQLNWNHGNQAWHKVAKHWMMLIVKRCRKLNYDNK